MNGDAEAEPVAQSHELFEDLALGDHVERGGRLVQDEHDGSSASAVAIITRWRMPPDSSCG